MPLNPEISLAGRPIDIKPPDPLTTLLGVAQYQNLQGQAALRDLQMQQARLGLAEYQRIQGPLQELQALQQGQYAPQQGGAPGPSPVASLGALPPAAYVPASGQPATQASMIPPALPGTSYAQAPGAAPNAAVNQLSPATQAPPGTTYAPQWTPAAGADSRNMVGIQRVDAPPPGQQPSVPGLPQGGGPSPGTAAPPAASSGGAGFQVPSPDALQRRLQVYRNLMAAGPTIGVPIAKEYMDMDVRELGLRKDALALQQEQLQKANEVLAGITDQTSYDEAKRVLAATGSPEVAQWGPNFNDPTTQARLAYRKAIAQTQQQRVQDQLKAAELDINAFKAHSERIGKETEQAAERRMGGEVFPTSTSEGTLLTGKYTGQTTVMPGVGGRPALSPEVQKNQTDQARLGRMVPQQTANGQWILVPEFPGANTGPQGGGTPQVSTPLTNPATNQPYQSLDAVKFQSEQERALRGEFEKVIQPFQSVRTAYNQVQASSGPAAAKNRNAADLSLLYGFAHLSNPESMRLNAPLTPEQIGTMGDRFKQAWDRVSKGGVLSAEQRRQITAQSAELYKSHDATYDQQLAVARQQASAYPNVRPDIAAPDIRANQPRTQTQTTTLGTRANPVTPAQISELAKRYGGTEADWRQKLITSGKVVQ